VAGFSGNTGTFDLTATFTGGFPVDADCEAATPIDIGTTVSGSNVGGNNADLPCNSTSDSEVWYTTTAPNEAGTLVVSTCDQANYDTSLTVFTGDCTLIGDCVRAEDTIGCGGFTSEAVVPVQPNETVQIAVGGFLGATGDFDLTVSFVPEPPPVDTGDTGIVGPTGDTGVLPPDPTGDTGTVGNAIPLSQAGGAVRINEFLADPNTQGTDTPCLSDAEFIELYNSGSVDVDLAGSTLRDLSLINANDPADQQDFFFPAGTIIPAGGFLVVPQVTADFEACFGTGLASGLELDRDTGFDVTLNNGGDTLGLYDENDAEVDLIVYDDETLTNPDALEQDGFSVEFDGTSWCLSATMLANGIYGTPGAANQATCPIP
jgi:hypothetical protein